MVTIFFQRRYSTEVVLQRRTTSTGYLLVAFAPPTSALLTLKELICLLTNPLHKIFVGFIFTTLSSPPTCHEYKHLHLKPWTKLSLAENASNLNIEDIRPLNA